MKWLRSILCPKSYMVLKASTSEDLENLVERYLNVGWRIRGGTGYNSDSQHWFQAIVK